MSPERSRVLDPDAGSARWPLWGGTAFLALSDPAALTPALQMTDQLVDGVDHACSRFRSDSDLSRANRRPGRWTDVDPLLVAAVRVALDAAEVTDGLVDPCLGRVMVSLGYDVDLAELVQRTGPAWPGATDLPVPTPPVPDAWRQVRTDEGAVRVPDGVALDLGATAKAWTADLVATTLVATLGCDVVVSLAGDLRVLGPDADAPARWPVRVAEHPDDEASGAAYTVEGGLATSSTLVRRWTAPGGPRHHLVDPRTGVPVTGGFRTVSAAGHTCVAANTASTAALVLGTRAPAWLAAHGVAARLVATDGTVSTTGSWPADPAESEVA